jgi:fumiquinazoline A oxidase
VYFGPKEEAMPYLEPLLALQPGKSNISTIPFNEVLNAVFFGQYSTSGGCQKGNNINIYSLALRQTDVAAWEAHFNELANFYAQYPGYTGRLLVQRFPNQAALVVADSATAYPLREAKIHV